MKKLLAVVLILVVLFPAGALGDLPDISNLSYAELVQLREEANLAIWHCQEWRKVTVWAGVWKIGRDIPAGKWTITAESADPYDHTVNITYCDVLNEPGTDADVYKSKVYYNQSITFEGSETSGYYPTFLDLDCVEGRYIIISRGAVVFSTYAGKPDLGFD